MKYLKSLLLVGVCLYSYSSHADWYAIKDSADKLLVIGTALGAKGSATAVYIQCTDGAPVLTVESRNLDEDLDGYDTSLITFWYTYLQKKEEIMLLMEPKLLPSGVVSFQSALKTKQAEFFTYAMSRGIAVEFIIKGHGINSEFGNMVLNIDGSPAAAAAIMEACKLS